MSGDHVTHQMGAPFHRGVARAEALKSLQVMTLFSK